MSVPFTSSIAFMSSIGAPKAVRAAPSMAKMIVAGFIIEGKEGEKIRQDVVVMIAYRNEFDFED